MITVESEKEKRAQDISMMENAFIDLVNPTPKDVPIKDYSSLYRSNGYVVNNDHDAYQNRLNAIQRVKRQEALEAKVDLLEEKLSSIEALLKVIAEK